MNRDRYLLFAVIVLALMAATPAAAQLKKPQPAGSPNPAANRMTQGTPAYAEVLLRETEARAEAEALSSEYTDDHPKVKEARHSLSLLQKERARLLLSFDPEKLTLALGKLLVRKVDAEVELWRLQQNLADGHPDVKRAKRKVEIYEAAIKEILG